MQLNLIIDDYTMDLVLPADLMQTHADAFTRLDAQMAEGVQLGRNWVAAPSGEQRCQVAAEKLLAAIEGHNQELAYLAAGYILSRRPGTVRVRLDTQGEPDQTRFE